MMIAHLLVRLQPESYYIALQKIGENRQFYVIQYS